MVAYSKNGHWVPTIPNQVCKHCGATYTAHRHGQAFCSKTCSGLSRRGKKANYVTKSCQHCGKQWEQRERAADTKFCSRVCEFTAKGFERARDANCEQCGKLFKSHFRHERDEWEKNCSRDCAIAALRKPVAKICPICTKEFITQPSRDDETCSWGCRSKYYLRDRTAAWKGGVVDQVGRVYRRIDRQGYVGKYEGEHRLIVAREIGRPLVRGEVVLCLNGDNDDWRPENLFLVPSQKEWSLIRAGAVEWPSCSNLQTYRVEGYVRPDVILVLHDWSTPRKDGRSRTRHPQADEIIKRRRAGATAAELAKHFGMSKSGMASILRNNL